MQVVIVADAEAAARTSAAILIEQVSTKPDSVLGLATGSTPLAVYAQLVAAYRQGAVSFAKVSTFNLDEYLGLNAEHPQSYHYYMHEHLFAHLDIPAQNSHLPQGWGDPWQAAADYENAIQAAGGIDLQLLGIGRNGHIGFNEPGSSLASRTRIKALTPATLEDNQRFFAAGEFQPTLSITMGIGTILEARKVLLLATGAAKAEAVAAMVEGPVSAACPASALQLHPQTILVVDEAAAVGLQYVDYYRQAQREQERLLAQRGQHAQP